MANEATASQATTKAQVEAATALAVKQEAEKKVREADKAKQALEARMKDNKSELKEAKQGLEKAVSCSRYIFLSKYSMTFCSRDLLKFVL